MTEAADEASLARRIAAAPQLSSAEAAHARVEDWLAEIAGTAAGKALARLLADHPTVSDAGGRAGGRLALSLGARARRPRAARRAARIRARAPLRASSSPTRARLIAAAGDEAEVMRLLRRMKAEAALLIALADIGGVWPVMEVTRRQTALADAALGAAVDYLLARGPPPRPAQARRPGAALAGLRLHRARHGQDGVERAQLFERHRSHRVLRRRRPGARSRNRAGRVLRAAHARAGEAAAGAHRRRLRVSHRSAAASRSGLDPDRHLHRRGARLLREPRAELGARRADQGAALRRRHRGRRGAAQGALAVHLAQVSRLCRGRRHPRHEAADPRLSRPRRDRGRGPQHQARPRRHPRDRVLRADPAAHRRRAPSGAARARDPGDARRAGRRRLDRRARRATISAPPTASCA